MIGNRLGSVIIKVAKNKNIRYLFSRYCTYFIQFVSSILIAVKLGPYHFGIWGFALLLINYFAIFDFGVANSMNVLVIQNRSSEKEVAKFISNSIFLVSLVNLFILSLWILNKYFAFEIIDKYDLKNLLFFICIVGALINYNNLLMHLYRISNRLFYLSFYQSVVPLLVFFSILFFQGEILLWILVGCYVIGNLSALILFIRGGEVGALYKIEKSYLKIILNKGLFLFLYNVCFYLILVSLRSFISAFYSIEEFGTFTFAFSLANSILLFLQAVSFLLYPKFVSKLNDDNHEVTKSALKNIRDVYVPISYLLIFIGLAFFPLFLRFIPKYEHSFSIVGLCALTVVLYCNSFGYSTYLVANNKERMNAFISILSLSVNLVLGIILIKIFHVTYEYIIFATMMSYLLYSYLSTYFAKRYMGESGSFLSTFNESFHYRLLLPYLMAVILVIFNFEWAMIIPLIFFLFLNWKGFKLIYQTIKRIALDGNALNL
ncbi:oligosaccharide flippase family protein [Sphingobacterium sp. DR205]|uniref:lipopolysaccharide biosynthesis protein n=1 Tax=Sphingobacterium sp. DR205 TaxID=2713573 RepID=UPI0013E4DC43|nr:oligosaccharide flippase family protein [Sphingobacterium sp. DR205]QIH31567.1 oligosaccharide flippase family protein [Sphingobacterium sp. DR205]